MRLFKYLCGTHGSLHSITFGFSFINYEKKKRCLSHGEGIVVEEEGGEGNLFPVPTIKMQNIKYKNIYQYTTVCFHIGRYLSLNVYAVLQAIGKNHVNYIITWGIKKKIYRLVRARS